MQTNNLHKRLLEPHRLRRVPSQFSWVDHRLVRQNHLPRAAAAAWGLYLVLVTVGDDRGLSYYADRTLCRLLSLSTDETNCLRRFR